jgi:CDP-4-dehydro-6-deoxyglucose reductase, E1
MVCTDDIELRDMLIMTRAHGRDRNLPSNRQEKIRDENDIDGFYSKYTFYTLGYNVRPHEIMGFL